MVGGYIDSDGSVTCDEGHYNRKLTQQNPQSLAVLHKFVVVGYMFKDHFIEGCKFRASTTFLGDECYYEAMVNDMQVIEVYPQYKVLAKKIMKAIGIKIPDITPKRKRKRSEKT